MVYVDDARISATCRRTTAPWPHLTAADDETLHACAARLGLEAGVVPTVQPRSMTVTVTDAPNPSNEIEELRRENDALREELWRQWEIVHSEHCRNEWPHGSNTSGSSHQGTTVSGTVDCQWPPPGILGAVPETMEEGAARRKAATTRRRRSVEFQSRVEARLAEWNSRYAADGVQCASPLMDRALAEEQVAQEMSEEAERS